jgi:hypothetical protein
MFAQKGNKRDIDTKVKKQGKNLEKGVSRRIGSKAILTKIAGQKPYDNHANRRRHGFANQLRGRIPSQTTKEGHVDKVYVSRERLSTKRKNRGVDFLVKSW